MYLGGFVVVGRFVQNGGGVFHLCDAQHGRTSAKECLAALPPTSSPSDSCLRHFGRARTTRPVTPPPNLPATKGKRFVIGARNLPLNDVRVVDGAPCPFPGHNTQKRLPVKPPPPLKAAGDGPQSNGRRYQRRRSRGIMWSADESQYTRRETSMRTTASSGCRGCGKPTSGVPQYHLFFWNIRVACGCLGLRPLPPPPTRTGTVC